MPSEQIIAMGGGGFSMEPDDPRMDRYILAQTGLADPKVCFIPPGPSADYIVRFYAALTQLPCRPSHLNLFNLPSTDLGSYILDKNVVYVGGGVTKSMLPVWREWGLDRILKLALSRGTILTGVSAGSMCWFEEGLTDSIPGTLTPLKCLGFLPGSNCPHHDGEPRRPPAYRRLIAEGAMMQGYAIDDGVALHFVEGKLHRVLSTRPAGRAYHITAHDGRAVDRLIEPEILP
jgi:peptidase E